MSAAECKFEGYLEQAIRYRLVCGLCSENAQKWLLTDVELTLAKAIDIAQSMETAERKTQEMKGAELAVRKVNHPRNTVSSDKEKPCCRCGRGSHAPWQCGFCETV